MRAHGLTGHHEADEQADAERQVGERDTRPEAQRAALQHYDGRHHVDENDAKELRTMHRRWRVRVKVRTVLK